MVAIYYMGVADGLVCVDKGLLEIFVLTKTRAVGEPLLNDNVILRDIH